jgi:hypothetical protein
MRAAETVLFEIDSDVRNLLSTPNQLDLSATVGFAEDRGLPFHVEIDAVPLLILVEEVALGARIYEFLSIRKPGDIQNYLRIKPIAVCESVAALFAKDPRERFPRPALCGEGYLPFVKFDSAFRWSGDDTVPGDERWLLCRSQPHWGELFTSLLGHITNLQKRLRQSDDYLARTEIARIDAVNHGRDFLPETRRYCLAKRDVPDITKLPASFFEIIEDLIARDNVQSVSCPSSDYWLWRRLVEEQVHRSEKTGKKPQSIFHLSGSDGGVGLAPVEDWGGEVHIPYEGACMADLFIQPDWRYSFPESDTEGGKLSDILYPAGRGYGRDQCHYLLTQKDLGELQCAKRTSVGDGWVLYQSNAPYAPIRNTSEDNTEDA